MDAAGHPHIQGTSSSCRAADYAAAWEAEQQQKWLRCQGSSGNQVGSSTENNSLLVSGPEFKVDNGENEEVDYYLDEEGYGCYDDDEEEDLLLDQGSSNNQVGSNTENNSLRVSGPEFKGDNGENEEEDYYFDEEGYGGYDDDDEGSGFEIDTVDLNQQLADKFDDLNLPPGVEATVPWLLKESTNGPDKFKSMKEIDDEIVKKYNFFKQFDTVEDFSDHHYAKIPIVKPSKEWVRRIQHEWCLLEKDLPALIYVRVSENRMDLLRAVMIGPQGTPYHDGLFFFDAHFPASYPTRSPVVYYHSGGLRLNPNLYGCGTVCLSLLGTWHGTSCEVWNPSQSTMLQVLISIQALVLNEMPYFNEPGYERSANTTEGQRLAVGYNDTTFQYSCRTMLYSLRKPPQHFEDLVAGHFRERGRAILAACKYYMEGHKVGSRVPADEEEDEGNEGSSSRGAAKPKKKKKKNKSALQTHRDPSFNTNMGVLFEELLMEFNVKGADTARFRAEKLKKSQQ